MAWDALFIAALAGTPSAMFAIERVDLSGNYTPIGDPFAVLSHPQNPTLRGYHPGAPSGVTLDAESLTVTDTPLDMRAAIGGGSSLSFEVQGEPGQLRAVYSQLKQGATVTLWAYLRPNDGSTRYGERVFTGKIASVNRAACRVLFEVLGLDTTAALDLRRDGNALTSGPMLVATYGTPVDTLASAYNPGDTHLHINHAAPWTIGPGVKGAVVVDDAFAVTYTGTATGPHRVTGLASVSTVSTSSSALGGAAVVDAMGAPVATYKERIANDPPLANRPSGSAVTFPAYYSGHPLAVARRILTSTGTATASAAGTNGADDLLPKSWGSAIYPSHIDGADIAAEESATPAALVERIEELDRHGGGREPGAFLGEILAGACYFAAMRQGLLTLRAVPDVFGTFLSPPSITIEDLDLDAGSPTGVEHDPWPQAFPTFRPILSVSNAAGYHVRTYIAGSSFEVDNVERGAIVLPDRWGPHGSTDACVTEIGDRIAAVHMMIPEVWTVHTRGLRLAYLCKGDPVTLTLPGETRRLGNGLVDGIRAFVLAVDVQWGSARVTLTLATFGDGPLDINGPPIDETTGGAQ